MSQYAVTARRNRVNQISGYISSSSDTGKMFKLRSLFVLRHSFLNKNSVRIQATACMHGVRFDYTKAYGKQINTVLRTLQRTLKCSQEEAFAIFDDFPSTRSIEAVPGLKQNIKTLHEFGVTSESIIENAFVLILTKGKFA